VLKITANVSHAVRRMEVRQANVEQLRYFFNKRKGSYYVHAFQILYQTIYQDFGKPKYYQRTYNTLRALDTDTFQRGESAGMHIFLNPIRGDIESKASKGLARGALKYYPAYVLRGIFFKTPGKMAERPFLQRWHDIIGDRFVKEFKQEFHDAVELH